MGWLSHWPSVWCSKCYLFHKILQNSLQNPFQFTFLFFFGKITKMKIKNFECAKSIRKKRVKESLVPSAQRTSLSYCRLLDFRWKTAHILSFEQIVSINICFDLKKERIFYAEVYNIQYGVMQSHEQINYRSAIDNASLIVLIMKNENI